MKLNFLFLFCTMLFSLSIAMEEPLDPRSRRTSNNIELQKITPSRRTETRVRINANGIVSSVKGTKRMSTKRARLQPHHIERIEKRLHSKQIEIVELQRQLEQIHLTQMSMDKKYCPPKAISWVLGYVAGSLAGTFLVVFYGVT